MRYQVIFKPSAEREIRKLPREVQRRIIRAADALAEDPFSVRHEKIRGMKDTYRVRVGDYRLVYEMQEKQLIILVLRVAHRREVYR